MTISLQDSPSTPTWTFRKGAETRESGANLGYLLCTRESSFPWQERPDRRLHAWHSVGRNVIFFSVDLRVFGLSA